MVYKEEVYADAYETLKARNLALTLQNDNLKQDIDDIQEKLDAERYRHQETQRELDEVKRKYEAYKKSVKKAANEA